jgi:DNA-binding GntR family transcriptional regulator
VIQRSTLRAQIAVALRDEILAGRLPTGRDFTVKEIAESYGVSATPVREALIDLAAQGLLEVEHHRGYRVHEFTAADFRAMVEARALVLDGIFRRLAARDGVMEPLSAAVLASVRRRAEAARRAALQGDLDVLIGYDLRYWRELGKLIGNAYIGEFLDRIRVQCWAFMVPHLRRCGTLAGRLWSGHCALVDALERRDAAETERLVRAYDDGAMELARQVCVPADRARAAPGAPG